MMKLLLENWRKYTSSFINENAIELFQKYKQNSVNGGIGLDYVKVLISTIIDNTRPTLLLLDELDSPKITYSDIFYRKSYEEVTYEEVLNTLTQILELDTPLNFDNTYTSISYDLNEPIGSFSIISDPELSYAITVQFLNQKKDMDIKSKHSFLEKKSLDTAKIIKDIRDKLKKEYYDNLDAELDRATTSEDAPLDKYAFSPERQNTKNPPPKEENNQYEKNLLKALIMHFKGNKVLSDKKADEIKQMMLKGLYADILIRPKVNSIYRGVPASQQYLETKLGLDIETINKIGYNTITIDKVATIKQRRSWTKNKKTAVGFSRFNSDNYEEKPFGVIFEANVTQNIENLLDCKQLYNITDIEDTGMNDETEVIALGDVVISKIHIKRKKTN